MTGRIITFYLDKVLFGIDIAAVKEVKRKAEYTTVPGTKACIAGLMNMRGQVVTLLDISKVMGLGNDKRVPGSSCIILKTGRGNNWYAGFLVEKLEDVLDIQDDWHEPLPVNMECLKGKFIRELVKLNGGLAAIIDQDKVINECMGQQQINFHMEG